MFPPARVVHQDAAPHDTFLVPEGLEHGGGVIVPDHSAIQVADHHDGRPRHRRDDAALYCVPPGTRQYIVATCRTEAEKELITALN